VLCGALGAVALDAEAWPLGLVGVVLLGIAAPTAFHLLHLVEASDLATEPGPAVLSTYVGAACMAFGTVVGFVVAGESPRQVCGEGHRLVEGACPTCEGAR
jgi:hypothetical protein